MRIADDGPEITMYPGFPLTVEDYQPLLEALREHGLQTPLRIAHSRGALDALASADSDETTLVLLAPSDPDRPRPGRRWIVGLLTVLARIPGVRGFVAEHLRRASFRSFGLPRPPGDPLPLREVASRLAPTPPPSGLRVPTVVLWSGSDDRHEEQLRLAARLKAQTVEVSGGHMFPLARPQESAKTIISALQG